MGSTSLKDVDSMDLSELAEKALEETYQGAPDRFSDPGEESPEIQHQDIASPVDLDAEPDKVLLVNIDFTEEKVFIPDGNRWSGRTVQFTNGRYIADRDTADRILAACPHVYEEPKSGEWFTHDESGFRTRSPQHFAKYVQKWADNR